MLSRRKSGSRIHGVIVIGLGTVTLGAFFAARFRVNKMYDELVERMTNMECIKTMVPEDAGEIGYDHFFYAEYNRNLFDNYHPALVRDAFREVSQNKMKQHYGHKEIWRGAPACFIDLNGNQKIDYLF